MSMHAYTDTHSTRKGKTLTFYCGPSDSSDPHGNGLSLACLSLSSLTYSFIRCQEAKTGPLAVAVSCNVQNYVISEHHVALMYHSLIHLCF
jgi:hypothetical protein